MSLGNADSTITTNFTTKTDRANSQHAKPSAKQSPLLYRRFDLLQPQVIPQLISDFGFDRHNQFLIYEIIINVYF
jgi:hypothetical protein